MELSERFDIREIAYDRWGATQMVQTLEEEGLTVVPFGQGFKSMSRPTKQLERLILSRGIVHNGNPVLYWMMDNVVAETNAAGDIKPDKKRSPEKIDGVVATVMALDRAIVCGLEDGSSVYEDGIMFI